VQVERQRAEGRQQRPDQRHQQEALAHAHLALLPVAHRESQRGADGDGDQDGFVVGAVRAVAAQPGEAERYQHQPAEAGTIRMPRM
jgi:hypothetical protein